MRTDLIEKPAPLSFVVKSRAAMGQKAAEDIAYEVSRCLQYQHNVRMILASAPSQSEMLTALMLMPDVDWSRIIVFHMDEYHGLASEAPQRFGLWLCRTIFDRLPFAAVHRLEHGIDPEATAAEYADRLATSPIDIVSCGIGSNGHLSFNDPPADPNDTSDVKAVTLDTASRQQHVGDSCFECFDDVHTHTLPLTIPRLLAANRIFCCVPGAFKKTAVRRTLQDPISGLVPGTALHTHSNWSRHLDKDSAADLASPEAL